MTTMTTRRPAWLLAGLILTPLGLALDLAAGAAILISGGAAPLALHLVAGAVWLLGLGLAERSAPHSYRNKRYAGPVWQSGWLVAGLLLGLLSFPGLGTASVSVAFSVSYLFRRRVSLPATELLVPQASVALPAVLGRGAGPAAQEIQHFVDVLREHNTERRRVVVKSLASQDDRQSIRLLRDLLADPNLDVRSDAAVLITRLEHDEHEAIRAAIAAAQARPRDGLALLALARRCRRYAVNGLVDSASAGPYLARAQTILAQLTDERPQWTDAWTELARVALAQDDLPAAQAALAQALTLRPTDADALALATEIAFRAGDWSRLFALAPHRHLLPAEQRAALAWWMPPTGGLRHG